MNEELETRLDERWLDYQTASENVIADLKADPANRYAHFKAWLFYVLKIVLFSFAGSAVLLITLYLATPQIWTDIPKDLVIRIWGWTAMIGVMFLPLLFSAPVRYWECRADSILNDKEIPHNHQTF